MKYLEKILDKNQKPFYRKDLEILLEKLEVKPGDIIMLHTSLKSFGYIVGGEETIIQTILEKIGLEGTLVMPSQSVDIISPEYWQYPEVPAIWFEDIKETILPYEKEKTPVYFILGRVATYFSRYPKVYRSDHPLYSFCAYGREADKITRNHKLDYGLGKDSPLQKMYDLNAKIVMLGTTFETNTALHLAEYSLGRSDLIESAPLLINNEKKWVNFKNIDLDIYDDFLEIQEAFFHKNREKIRFEDLPCGKAYCFSMRDCVDFTKEYYKKKQSMEII